MPRDIEEFLKMAAKRRQQQKQQGGGAARSRPASAPGGQQRPARQRHSQPPTPVQPATDEEIVILGPGGRQPRQDMRSQSVSEHVRSHIDTSDLAEKVSHLGEEVGLADDKLVARLQDTFDHDVGHLKFDPSKSVQDETTSVTAKRISPLARDMIQMLSNPVNVRQAILISEVLKRPEI